MQAATEADRNWLKTIATSSKCERQKDDDRMPIIRQFYNSLVLDYRNGERWYQVMPLARKELGLA